MASTDPEIKDGFTLPVWMKTKPTKEFEPFAASPPPAEDAFFYIKYPKTDVLFGKPKIEQDFSKVLNRSEMGAAANFNTVKEQDWSKHTKPCQDVMHGITPINTTVNSQKPKPAGTDDGFKGESSACGSSVVKVAHQMILSSRPSPRGFTVASPSEDDDQMFQTDDHSDIPQYARHMSRRGSKSLPVTPVQSPNSSPTSRRRKNGNRYFTSPFEPVEDEVSVGRSWLTAALLGYKKDLAASTPVLTEEDAIETRLQGGTLAQSVEFLGPAPPVPPPKSGVPTQQPKLSKPSHTFRPKPSELREMNFWSPTSM